MIIRFFVGLACVIATLWGLYNIFFTGEYKILSIVTIIVSSIIIRESSGK